MFVIEDEWHAEPQRGEFKSLEEAIDELRRRTQIPWNTEPNLAPCMSWRTCGRNYEIIEYDTTHTPWEVISTKSVLEIDAKGVRWKI